MTVSLTLTRVEEGAVLRAPSCAKEMSIAAAWETGGVLVTRFMEEFNKLEANRKRDPVVRAKLREDLTRHYLDQLVEVLSLIEETKKEPDDS